MYREMWCKKYNQMKEIYDGKEIPGLSDKGRSPLVRGPDVKNSLNLKKGGNV